MSIAEAGRGPRTRVIPRATSAIGEPADRTATPDRGFAAQHWSRAGSPGHLTTTRPTSVRPPPWALPLVTNWPGLHFWSPLLGVVQIIAAHVGSVAGGDLQTLTAKRYGRGVAGVLLMSVLVVNDLDSY